MDVKGFPTLKLVKPGKTPGRPIVEDYQGPRTAKGIVDAVIDKIPNLVKRVEDKSLESWLAEANDTAKAILFSDKGKTSALLKALAIEFKGSIKVAQIRNTEKEKASLELFGISNFPTLLLLPGGKEAEGIVYDGEMKKEAMVKFLSQAAEPNPDPAPAKVKVQSKEKKKTKKTKEAKKEEPAAADETLVEDATESTQPSVEAEKPVDLPAAPPLDILETPEKLEAECFGPKTGTCVLAFVSSSANDKAAAALTSLSEVAHKHKMHARKLFPFYQVPAENAGAAKIRDALKLGSETAVIAVNGRRGWWRNIPSGDSVSEEDVREEAIERWVDAIRLGEGAKHKIPAGLIPEEAEGEEAEAAAGEAQEPIVTEEKEKEKEEKQQVHNEL